MKYLKFYSPTCQPCQQVDHILQEKGIEYESINVLEDKETRSKFGIIGVPTVIVLDDEGNEIKRAVGVHEIQKL